MHILHVEDNPGDLVLCREALARADFECQTHQARDAESAMDFLSKRGEHKGAPDVDLVLLDLNLVGSSGHDVLFWLREQPRFRELPVVVLTSSARQKDVHRAVDNGATNYCVKPRELRQFVQFVEQITTSWVCEDH